MTCAVQNLLSFAAGSITGALIAIAGIFGAVAWAYRKGVRG